MDRFFWKILKSTITGISGNGYVPSLRPFHVIDYYLLFKNRVLLNNQIFF